MYSALKTLGDSATFQLPQHPSKIPAPKLPKFQSKEAFRKWCIDVNTCHVFFSLNEGLNPHVRISGSNPAYKMHGFVGDYDGDELKTRPMVDIIDAIKTKAHGSWCPTWVCRTYSGRIRVIWEFEDFLFIDNESFSEKIIDALVKVTQSRSLLKKGCWDDASKNPAIWWELGSDWQPISQTKVTKLATEKLFFDCAKTMGGPKGRVNVPVEVVAEKVNEVFPNRWVGDFDLGCRGPLFWVDDGVQRVGAIVQEGGMWCFSTRAGKSFIPWAEIFGENFVREFRENQLNEAIEDTWFDGKKYWVKDGRDTWAPLVKEDFTMRLRLAGFSHSARKQNDPASQIDEVLTYVQDHRRIYGAAPFLFNGEEVVEMGGRRYINTATVEVMQPADTSDTSKWPHLWDWWNNFLDDGSNSTLFFLTWLKRMYVSALAGKPLMGHSLIMAGDADKGKSLFSTFLLPKIFGGGGDCGEYLMGIEKFNKELVHNPIWYIDDNISCSNQAEHRRFTEMLKKMTATPKVKSREMYSEPVDIDRVGRIILTTNTDADSLSILPNLNGTILDKLVIFKMCPNHQPWFLKKENYEIEEIILNELPYALKYIQDFVPPKRVTQGSSSRYGMNAYHHSGIISIAQDLNPDQRDWEMLQFWWSMTDGHPWVGNVSALMGELEQYEPLRVFTRSMNKVIFGKTMAKLSNAHPDKIKRHISGDVVEYTIDLK